MSAMTEAFSVVYNSNITEKPGECFVSPRAAAAAPQFHAGLPGYAPTPLVSLPALARALGLAEVRVKDESKRFALNSFKALGGSFAAARVLCEKYSLPLDGQTLARLCAPELAPRLRGETFITATDGNHGRGVAWTAKVLNCRAVVYLPEGTAAERLENILALGARAEITDMNYDDTVRYASREAAKNGWTLVQDTSWPGYEDVPAAIMQGYTTLAHEIAEQLGERLPTHLFLQAGVGSMAGAIAGYFSSLWGENAPKVIIVEPDRADCLFRTARANDGRLHTVTGRMDSMMAGLCCGEPCTLGWQLLKDRAAAFVSCGDAYAARGMRLLAKPTGEDAAIESGESGAVTAGVLAAVMTDADKAGVRRALALDESSRVLLISTEGATDRANYLRICGGAD